MRALASDLELTALDARKRLFVERLERAAAVVAEEDEVARGLRIDAVAHQVGLLELEGRGHARLAEEADEGGGGVARERLRHVLVERLRLEMAAWFEEQRG